MARPAKTTTSREQVGRRLGFRSGLEKAAADQLKAAGVPVAYEEVVLPYTIPARQAKYTVDFRLPDGTLIETKGRFVTEDRKKHKLIRDQYPDLKLVIVFQNPNARISKKSATTYAKWCDDHGIAWAKAPNKNNPIPKELLP